jgi:hypothetical protein
MAASDPREIGSDLLLVHEGTGDLNVLGALMRHAAVEGFQPFELEGPDSKKLRKFFKALAMSPHFRNPVPGYGHPVRGLAVILDADANATATFQRVRDALAAANLPTPAAPGEVLDGAPRIGVFLVPDNAAPGKIETLCLRSVESDPAWGCLETFFQCVTQKGGKLPANMDKARAQAFLSTRPNPALPVGLAADEGYWNFDHAAFAPLIAFLRDVSR